MGFILNIIWFVFGGLFMGLAWYLIGALCFITIIGIPWAKACFIIGNYTFFPFGREAISREQITGEEDIGTGPLGFIGNVIWFLVAGFWLAIGHLAAAFACAITIIGIPWAWAHLKLARISLCPIGQEIVDK